MAWPRLHPSLYDQSYGVSAGQSWYECRDGGCRGVRFIYLGDHVCGGTPERPHRAEVMDPIRTSEGLADTPGLRIDDEGDAQ